MTKVENLKPGDMIFAAADLYNDGSIPGVDNDACIALAGTRGVLVNTGHLEEDEDSILLLVRFEDAELNLGPAVTCWPHELSADALDRQNDTCL